MDDTHKMQHGSAAAAAGAPETARYEQDLSRSIGILGNVFITLSGVTPASSVFIIVPVALVAAGSGSFLAFVFAAIVGVFMAFCWAELSAAFPIAARDYALVWHSFKGRTSWLAGPVSFVTFALYVDFIAFIPAVIALGTGTYLAVIVNVNLKVIGAIVMLVAAGIAILNIRLNAVITGIFLAIELIALAIVTVLGFTHAKNWSSLFHPVVGNAHGGLICPLHCNAGADSRGCVLLQRLRQRGQLLRGDDRLQQADRPRHLVGTGDHGPGRADPADRHGRRLAVDRQAEHLFGADEVLHRGHLEQHGVHDRQPGRRRRHPQRGHRDRAVLWADILQLRPGPGVARPGQWLDDRQERAVQVAVGRDRGGRRARRRPVPHRLPEHAGQSDRRQPGRGLCAIAIAALFARPTGATRNSPYKMPLWPLPPILALASLGYIFTQQTSLLLEVTLITIGIGLLYWLAVIFPQRGRAWNLREAVFDEAAVGDDG